MGMGGGNAAKKAEETERQRQSQIASTSARVNEVYDSPQRAVQQQGFFQSLRNMLTGQVNDQNTVASRNLKFANARGGLTGGSASADSNVQLGKDYTKGLLEATRKSQGALAQVQGADDQSRAQLLQLAQTGLDTGTAAQQAASSMRVNLENASKASMGGIDDVFKTTSDIWKRSQEAAEKRRGMTTPVGSLYGDNAWS